jgi:hypothetical protein
MADSVQVNRNGFDWPLGWIGPTSGTPKNIMVLVDPTLANNPSSPNWSPATATGTEYAIRCHEIIFTPGAKDTHGIKNNTGNAYVMRKGVGGAGNLDDYGSIVAVIRPGDPPFRLTAPPNVDNSINPYSYYIDVNTTNDGVIPTLIISG